MRWKIDECPDAEGNWTLREDDGTEHGNTETCIATVYGGEQEQNLIESAPLLAERVRILCVHDHADSPAQPAGKPAPDAAQPAAGEA